MQERELYAHGLFTPDGYAPALAELNLESLLVDEQVFAIEGLVRKVAQDYSPRQLLEAIANAAEYRGREWGDAGNEKSTHFAHLLSSTDERNPLNPSPGSVTVWLHHYGKDLPPAGSNRRYIENHHTHRGSVSSILLDGGYIFRERRLPDYDTSLRRPLAAPNASEEPEDWLDLYEYLAEREAVYPAGAVMHVDPDEIHGLKAVVRGTMSLVVRPTLRPFSTVFVEGSDGKVRPKIARDMPSQRQQLSASIGNLLTHNYG